MASSAPELKTAGHVAMDGISTLEQAPTDAGHCTSTVCVSQPRISIVIPCLNGADSLGTNLPRLHRFLSEKREELGTYEVLFVDDGSTDGSARVARAQLPEVRLLRHESCRGKGAAVRTGVAAATGRFIFFVDADIPYCLDVLPQMLDYLDRKDFQLCIGTRSRVETEASRNRSLARRIASAVFTAFVSRIVVTGIRDTQCGLKGFRADTAKYLFNESRIENFALDVEILYLAFKNDFDIKKIPVYLEHDEGSSVSLTRHALPMLYSIIKLPFRYHLGGYRLIEDKSLAR